MKFVKDIESGFPTRVNLLDGLENDCYQINYAYILQPDCVKVKNLKEIEEQMEKLEQMYEDSEVDEDSDDFIVDELNFELEIDLSKLNVDEPILLVESAPRDPGVWSVAWAGQKHGNTLIFEECNVGQQYYTQIAYVNKENLQPVIKDVSVEIELLVMDI